METNLKVIVDEEARQLYEQNIYTMLKDAVLDILEYSKISFTNQEILVAIKNAVNIEKDLESIFPKDLSMRNLIDLGNIADVTEVIYNTSRAVKGIVPVLTLVNIDLYIDSIVAKANTVETLEDMIEFIANLHKFTDYITPAEIDQAIENHSWSEEERKVGTDILINLNNDTITTPEEDTKMDIQNNGFGLRVSKEAIRKLVEEKFFNEELSKMYSRHQKISVLTELIKWSAANAPSNNYRFVGASEGSTTIITIYKLGEVLHSFQIDGTSISEVEIDTEFENLLKLGY